MRCVSVAASIAARAVSERRGVSSGRLADFAASLNVLPTSIRPAHLFSRLAGSSRCITSRASVPSPIGVFVPSTSRRWRSSVAPSVADQERLLEHYAVGLRRILSRVDVHELNDAGLVDALRRLRDEAPMRLARPFMGAPFLAMAFGHELGFAAAHPPALRAVFDLGVAAAEAGLVPYQSIRSAHGQLANLGLLRCARVDPKGGSVGGLDETKRAPGDDAVSEEETPPSVWEVFGLPGLRDAARRAAAGLEAEGAAVVDDAFGRRGAAAVRAALRRHADEARASFTPGELDQTGRSDQSSRGDRIAWLSGDEGIEIDRRRGFTRSATGGERETEGTREREDGVPAPLLGPPREMHAGAAAQLMRSCLSDYLSEALPSGTLLPSDGYVANAMLSIYAPGAPGFVPHTDNCGPGDARRVTAVYYPNDAAWDASWGGEMVLWPRDPARRREVAPVGDRLVVFRSDEVEHEVLPVADAAPTDRLALSFWYLKPTGFDPGLMTRG